MEKQTEINRENILYFLTLFYSRLRKHEEVGKIFEDVIGTDDQKWQEHIEHICEFWCSLILKSRTFNGSPMQKHIAIKGIKRHHFDQWLGIFEQTAKEVYTNDCSDIFISRSQQIARSLSMGIEISRQKNNLEY